MKRPQWLIDKWVSASVANSKGKTYEEIYGPDRAATIKNKRSQSIKEHCALNPPSGRLNPNYDEAEYTFYNTTTGTIITATKLVFHSCYNIRRSDISDIMRGKTRAGGWCLIMS